MYEAEAKAMKEFLEKARAIQKDINEINESEIENKAERNLIDYLDKIGHDVVKREPENEKILVREFGERIGYGNLMQLASECWQESLKAKGLPPGGAFSVGLPYDLLIKKESEDE
jgi:hypothetical protein